MGDMISKKLGVFCSAAEVCALTMLDNADFIAKELPSIGIDEHYKKEIENVAASLADTKYEVCEILGSFNERSHSAASDITQGRVAKVYRMLYLEIPKLRELVFSLESASKGQENIDSAYILVAESAMNIVESYNKVSEAVGNYQDAVKESAAANPAIQ